MWKNFNIELKGLARAILLSLFLAAVAAVVVYYTSLSEKSFRLLAPLILAIGVFAGAAYVARERATRGLVRGLNFGIMVFILMLIATVIVDPSLITLRSSIYNLLLCMASGALGGILGIGLSNNS
ncbi:MAG: TIGR04086 family membrane protein [Syntrophomonadaceae bacterium]|nr:TIGR04086 family membrane protein [Syntrophomonadaceae bacterium]